MHTQVFDEPEKTYMVMELLTGGNVMDRIVELDHCSEQVTCHMHVYAQKLNIKLFALCE